MGMDKSFNTDTNNFSSQIAQNSHLAEATSDLLRDGKKVVNCIYEDGMQKMTDMQDTIKDYSSKWSTSVQDKPVKSMLIACGVGYLISVLWRH